MLNVVPRLGESSILRAETCVTLFMQFPLNLLDHDTLSPRSVCLFGKCTSGWTSDLPRPKSDPRDKWSEQRRALLPF